MLAAKLMIYQQMISYTFQPSLLAAIVDREGSPRRCGGQGDFLAGSVALFGYWASSAAESR